MGFLARANALFLGLRVTASYHQALKVDDVKTAKLKDARRAVRDAIRTASTRIQIEDRYWEADFAHKAVATRPAVQPKFFTQGSFAYDLLVAPCQPSQQLDLDDGMYVVVDYLQNGKPALVAKMLFEMVEAALAPLCAQRGWTLNTSKQTCVRVEIASDAHIDIPIYSAPREVAESKELAAEAFAQDRIAKRANRIYVELPSDKIMLAHRDGTWQQSDPLKLHNWVEACVVRYGEDFRRACRYFKGWRDYTWAKCCLSSITIMVAVAEALERLYHSRRGDGDDRLVYEIGQLLPDILDSELYNPSLPDQRIVLNDWSDDDRAAVVSAARTFADQMDAALKRSADQTLVVNALRKAFGSRLPLRPDVVEILPPATAAVVAVKPATVPSPSVKKSTSG
jgi:hypothetical protein